MSSPGGNLDHGSALAKSPSYLHLDSETSASSTTIGVSHNVDSGGITTLATTANRPLSNGYLDQHAITSYFSLIEGRCRTQAVRAMNARRHPQDQLADNHPEVYQLAEFLFAEAVVEMKRAGLIPQEVAIPGPQQRQNYLLAFDQRLNDLAARHNASTLENYSYKTIEDSNGYSNSGDASSLFERSASQALIAHPLVITSRPSATSPLGALIHPSRGNNYAYESPYYRKFKEICLLGKGGFGQVFRVRHLLDNQDYAVKKIRVSVNQIRSIHNDLQLDGLLRELRALAKLQHRNVVRYYDSWWEERPASSRNMKSERRLIDLGPHGSSNSDESNPSESSADSQSTRGEENLPGLRSLQAGFEVELRKDAKKKRKEQSQQSADDAMVIFEDSYQPSSPNGAQPTQSQASSKSSVVQSIFRKPSEISEEEESTEDIERSASALPISEDEKEAMIFLQMAPYPMTLEDYLWPEQQACAVSKRIQHCFHALTTAQILLAILDGVQYIHDQAIVHRDLKPSNIFLSVQTGRVQPEGSINVTACKECHNYRDPGQQIFLTPHIGDFGLIAKINDVQSENRFRPSPMAVFSSVASSRQAGTMFYAAPQPGKRYRKVICPKLDVYSIGVIACEMLMRFGTKSERLTVLSEVNKGELDGLQGHRMERGIRAMLCHDREKRWDCVSVRRWLADFVKAG
ncbi:kinase-like domain-containing protein [Amylocarpus encephaloides]|uniref:non-specific serine/threonine protein kinase n=1 Tax=Amylocarpus encephaloides TaxID=45428 RepID=A0A9P7YLV0_9HELO|nr:kinase-like domain-containing protein [Amylocarpus encephaloides]